MEETTTTSPVPNREVDDLNQRSLNDENYSRLEESTGKNCVESTTHQQAVKANRVSVHKMTFKASATASNKSSSSPKLPNYTRPNLSSLERQNMFSSIEDDDEIMGMLCASPTSIVSETRSSRQSSTLPKQRVDPTDPGRSMNTSLNNSMNNNQGDEKTGAHDSKNADNGKNHEAPKKMVQGRRCSVTRYSLQQAEVVREGYEQEKRQRRQHRLSQMQVHQEVTDAHQDHHQQQSMQNTSSHAKRMRNLHQETFQNNQPVVVEQDKDDENASNDHEDDFAERMRRFQEAQLEKTRRQQALAQAEVQKRLDKQKEREQELQDMLDQPLQDEEDEYERRLREFALEEHRQEMKKQQQQQGQREKQQEESPNIEMEEEDEEEEEEEDEYERTLREFAENERREKEEKEKRRRAEYEKRMMEHEEQQKTKKKKEEETSNNKGFLGIPLFKSLRNPKEANNKEDGEHKEKTDEGDNNGPIAEQTVDMGTDPDESDDCIPNENEMILDYDDIGRASATSSENISPPSIMTKKEGGFLKKIQFIQLKPRGWGQRQSSEGAEEEHVAKAKEQVNPSETARGNRFFPFRLPKPKRPETENTLEETCEHDDHTPRPVTPTEQ